ncbi:hypothetical protein AVU87_gp20 [Mycobacterium phage Theia]|uniref:Uncharacterized protein n=2 Tax=Benedictvirus TaxID=2946819 RepID=A0A0N9S0L3_9CAUD|nr:hypothetical protein AVU87_gp20 [Mycobacterium phage Theia]YP_009638160.1 hypothetical protein FGG35_gp20 [Mycobacterium phage Cuco]AVR76653.1 hypothetical protein SEA_COOG_71 [Mycobacterium phage Coog]AVR77198.1 hypothetical protein SEA_MIDAS2_71 [Mycobacterium phage Midas2]AEL17694.1 hypothetical protein CUCO_73 [Mycobacterium phage Cuco]ALH46925.1 hypothetical protein SEA_THEIA_73 [Mycobacterium phage Theia]
MIEISISHGSRKDIHDALKEVAEDVMRGYIPTDAMFRTRLWGAGKPIGTILVIPESAFD